MERFIEAAASDPQTVAIKMTVYRVGDDTPFVRSLIRAAEAGKQVACIVEVKARFDEARNLHWAQQLEKVGAHVVYGVLGLKTHTKLALVVRKEAGGLRCYAHIGTGNYHVRTARLYTDVGLFTCDPVLTGDVVKLFHYLTGRSLAPSFDKLLVAPMNMRERFLELIEREIEHARAGRPARIVAKMNQLQDLAVGRALAAASQAGVPVDLIVRGFCCLLPGVPGLTENIRIRSVIGRFLEHSRIFYFANGHADPLDGEFFIGSADWMYRNLSRRVEAATPVVERALRERLWEILDVCLRDSRHAWILGAAGRYAQSVPVPDGDGPETVGTHAALIESTRRRIAVPRPMSYGGMASQIGHDCIDFVPLDGLLALAARGSAAAFDLQGHRGARGLAPENTIAAFKRALEIGVTTIETDLGITRDGVVVIAHDRRLNPALTRGPDGEWLARAGPAIRSLSLAELTPYDVGRLDPASAYAKSWTQQVAADGERFPTLAELFELDPAQRQAGAPQPRDEALAACSRRDRRSRDVRAHRRRRRAQGRLRRAYDAAVVRLAHARRGEAACARDPDRVPHDRRRERRHREARRLRCVALARRSVAREARRIAAEAREGGRLRHLVAVLAQRHAGARARSARARPRRAAVDGQRAGRHGDADRRGRRRPHHRLSRPAAQRAGAKGKPLP